MTTIISDLADYGWTLDFAAHLDAGDLQTLTPARVMAVHRDRLHVAAPGLDAMIEPLPPHEDATQAATVGDWLLLDVATHRALRLVPRKSLFKRRAAGTGRKIQLIAANVDTLLLVTSCNADFNVARLERYLTLAREAGVTPVVVLTKADLSDAASALAVSVRGIQPGLMVETVDARDPAAVECLKLWCGRGQTVVLAGSSGVGKSTLINTLTTQAAIATQGVRVGDDKGRHTTTGRQMYRLPAGGWLIDTPGMRELQLTDVASGIDDVFADLSALAATCRFADCRHETEPGCAIKSALASAAITPDRVRRWQKLLTEDARNARSLAERRAQERAFGKLAKGIISGKRSRR